MSDRQRTVQKFISLPGVDPTVGFKLYDMGYTSLDMLADAKPRELTGRGIPRQLAKNITQICGVWKASGKGDIRKAVQKWRQGMTGTGAAATSTKAKAAEPGIDEVLKKQKKDFKQQLDVMDKKMKGRRLKGKGEDVKALPPAGHERSGRKRRYVGKKLGSPDVDWDAKEEEIEAILDEVGERPKKRKDQGPALDKHKLIKRKLNNTFEAINEVDRRGLHSKHMWDAYNKADYAIRNGDYYNGAKLLEYCLRKADLSIRKDELGLKDREFKKTDDWDLTETGRWQLFKWWLFGKDRRVQLPEGYKELDEDDHIHERKTTPIWVWILRVTVPIMIGLGIMIGLLWYFGFLRIG